MWVSKKKEVGYKWTQWDQIEKNMPSIELINNSL